MKNQKKLLFPALLRLLVIGCMLFSGFAYAYAQGGIKVTGKVVDPGGEPLVGVAVLETGTSNGTITDANGAFSINVRPQATLKFSYVGFKAQTVTVGNQTRFDITMVDDAEELGEVVVTALGITKDAKKLGYAATVISSGDLLKSGTANLATALYGKASGVNIQSTQGGAAGGVSINLRGLSSINGNTQPLVILNGVPIRNGNASKIGDNNTRDFASLGSGDRIRSNGLVDINPEDIDQLTILKGAAATALYGSEAANGAIVITSKKASGSGVTVDVNASLQANMVAEVPDIQTKYGPGGGYETWTAEQIANNGMKVDAATGKLFPNYTNFQWGAPYDGRDVLYIDGTTRPYSAITTQPWKELFRTGTNQTYNIAINQGSENSTTRFSYTFLKEVPNALTSDYQKHNFNVVGNLKFNDKLSVDYTGNYITQHFVNRAQASIGTYQSWSNMFASFLDIPLMKKMYKTSLGYKNDDRGAGPTPDEKFKYNSNEFVHGVRQTLWDIYDKTSDEVEQRLLASASPTWKITPWLTAKGRIATDYTTSKIIGVNYPEFPAAASTSEGSGGYNTMTKYYQVNYGDIMLMLDKKLNDKFGVTASAGWQGRAETMNSLYLGTNRGLSIEGLYMINNSYSPLDINDQTEKKMELLKTAWVGTLGVSYGDYLYLDITGRQEKSSTLPKDTRNYFYPSASASFLFTDAFSMPSWYDFGKLRLAYGIVGNAPEAYAANMAYTVGSAPGWSYNQVPADLGNEKLKPETTKEFEIGLESKFLNNRLGFEVSYYNRRITDMLLKASLATSSGSNSMWVNSGTMENKGVELSLYGSIIDNRNLTWEVRGNIGFNRNKILKLVEGINFIETGYFAGGIGKNYSTVGRPMGDYVTYINQVVEDGPYKGRKIVNDDGNYMMTQTLEVIGSAMPDATGGIGTSLSYKNFTFDVMTDFRIGGYIFNEVYHYTMTAGVNPETENREGEGFYEHTYDNGLKKQTGIILDGVVSDGKGGWTENKKTIPYEKYIQETYDWGGGGNPNRMLSTSENTWWKLRELSLSYTFKKDLIKNAALKNLTLSVFGRNLCYFYKTIPNYDPETSNGTNWKDQLTIGGSAAPTRTVGVSLRASF
ncbi:MAG: SusC/RagA family TonB-linked outer membrane protein [Tannerellaceae bacterium]|jgi:TonB-linked SusC/RagA family outer membrane protein|nr:SusC/RagA family TonB-linked outer membrane protein [Tannerellaceae bacterium]